VRDYRYSGDIWGENILAMVENTCVEWMDVVYDVSETKLEMCFDQLD